MRRKRTSALAECDLRAMRKQILRCLDTARLVILMGFRDLERLPKRRRRGHKLLAWATAVSIALALVNLPGDCISDTEDLVHYAGVCVSASD